jgi:hypothetical protein
MDNSFILYKIEKYKNKLNSLNFGDIERRNIYEQKLNYYYEILGGGPTGQGVPRATLCNDTKQGLLNFFLIRYFHDVTSNPNLDKIFNGKYGYDEKNKKKGKVYNTEFTWGIYKKTLMLGNSTTNTPINTPINTPNTVPPDFVPHNESMKDFFYPILLIEANRLLIEANRGRQTFSDVNDIKECFKNLNLKHYNDNGQKLNLKDDTLMTKDIFKQIFPAPGIRDNKSNPLQGIQQKIEKQQMQQLPARERALREAKLQGIQPGPQQGQRPGFNQGQRQGPRQGPGPGQG